MALNIKIEVNDKGQLNVSNFPNNVIAASQIMADASKAVANYFAMQANKGNMDKNGTVTENKIIKPDHKIIPIGG